MQILVILGLMSALAPERLLPVRVALSPGQTGLAVGAYLALTWLLTRLAVRWGLRRLGRSSAPVPGGGVAAAAIAIQTFLVVGSAALALVGYGHLIRHFWRLGGVPLAPEVLLAAPFVAGLLVFWWGVYPLERAIRSRAQMAMALAGEPVMPTWTGRQSLGFSVRTNLLFVAVPVAVIVLLRDVLAMTSGVLPEWAAGAAMLAAAAAVFVAAPWMVVRIWSTAPLPAGELRQRLEQLCGRLNLRYRRILLWRTGGNVVNAGVIGVIAPVRYVLLSDALLQRLPPLAVESVFAHEAGHARHHHIPYMLLLTAAVLTLGGTLGDLLANLAGENPTARALADSGSVAVALAAWLWLFGRLSRLFERQADVFAASRVPLAGAGGAVTPEGARLFAEALLAVGRLNGIAPDRPNFRHGSIQRRIDYLARLAAQPGQMVHPARRVRLVKLGLWALLAVAVTLAIVL
jgi:STE24 endopeptidase